MSGNEELEKMDKYENSNEEILKEANVKKEGKFIKLLKRIFTAIIDQVISIALALLILIVFDFLIGLAGYYVSDRESMFLLLYIIINVLYRPVLISTKLEKTIGEKLNLKYNS
ncbi:RDD family protein [Caproiciproducens sp. MSJ-32]|uniref:RDD family protein n=1 Tax=Caproiciproducens sp. MSJ-32 TaxID=2841527 RepID=UPI001C0FB89E|nr:RDD family protein [Caproiciproducens sp. MSJ-32]MBU5454475.1 RDD family protein [Caproiciproducens sp. MSJ-32]